MSGEQTFFDDPAFSDITVKFGRRSIHAHRVILCRRSDYFKKLLTGDFKDSTTREIELHEDDEDAVVTMLRHIYGEPFQFSRSGADMSGSLVATAEVGVVADKYQLKSLETECRRRICRLRWVTPDADFWSCLRILFTKFPDTNNAIKTSAIDSCATELATLRKHEDFKSLLRDFPKLGLAIFESEQLNVGSTKFELYRCPDCGSIRDFHNYKDRNACEDGYCQCDSRRFKCSACGEVVDSVQDNVRTFVQVGS